MADLVILATAEARGFGINPNLWETNLFNIVIFVGVLIYLGRDIVANILTERRRSIESQIAEAEQRQAAAMAQLAQAQEQLAAAQATCAEIKKKAEADAQAARAAILATTEAELQRLQAQTEQEIAAEQAKVQFQLQQELVERALAEVRAYLDRGLSEQQHQQLIDRSIAKL
ncbi:MAG: F0F1 ATP synthase subunit B [Pseudanabaenaceae cyanobacterium]